MHHKFLHFESKYSYTTVKVYVVSIYGVSIMFTLGCLCYFLVSGHTSLLLCYLIKLEDDISLRIGQKRSQHKNI